MEKVVISNSFRILKGALTFEYTIAKIGTFKGNQNNLLKDIKESGLTMLSTKSWEIDKYYSINYDSIVSNFRNKGKLSKVLEKYRVENNKIKSEMYDKFSEYLRKSKKDKIKLTIIEIEEIIKAKLPQSIEYDAWWSNDKSHPLSKRWIEEGFLKTKETIIGQTLVLTREKFENNSTSNFNKFKKNVSLEIANLVEKIHGFILNLDDKLVYKELRDYHSYKGINKGNNSAINIEFSGKRLKITIYCEQEEIKELHEILKKNNISWDPSLNMQSKGNLRLRPLISTIEELELIKPLIALGIDKYFNTNEKGVKISIVKNFKELKRVEKDLEKVEGKEKETIVKQRINQGIFRKSLIEKYKKCCLCGITDERLLIASHIKPWSKSNPIEKLDSNNGLLLCSNHDTLFDKGLITFDEKGKIKISNSLDSFNQILSNLKFEDNLKIKITSEIQKYIKYHRKNEFLDNKS